MRSKHRRSGPVPLIAQQHLVANHADRAVSAQCEKCGLVLDFCLLSGMVREITLVAAVVIGFAITLFSGGMILQNSMFFLAVPHWRKTTSHILVQSRTFGYVLLPVGLLLFGISLDLIFYVSRVCSAE